jgi:hypothetical protein
MDVLIVLVELSRVRLLVPVDLFEATRDRFRPPRSSTKSGLRSSCVIIVTFKGDALGSALITTGGEFGSILVVVKYFESICGSWTDDAWESCVASGLVDLVDRRGVVGVDMMHRDTISL